MCISSAYFFHYCSWGCLELTRMTFMTAARDNAVEKVNIDHINIKIIKGLFFQTYAYESNNEYTSEFLIIFA